jgi:K+-sensing histidine kinase KdpD
LERFSGLSLDFNQMAEQVESLLRIRGDLERSRVRLFRELAHDVRTPLTSIRAASDALAENLEGLQPAQRLELAKAIQSESIYLAHLVSDLHYVSEHSTSSQERVRVDLRKLVEETIEKRRVRRSAPALQWSHFTGHVEVLYLADPTHCTRLLTNLLDNAERFARTRVEVRLETDGRAIRLSVLDDGPGMAPEAIEDYGTARSVRSQSALDPTARWGLGSAIVRSIVEGWQGSLELKNGEWGGLEVTVIFSSAD